MQIDISLVAASTAVLVGFSAFWSNPRRTINRLFLTLSLHAALWLISLRTTFASAEGLFWLRNTTAIGAYFPLHFWLIKETVVNVSEPFGEKLRRAWPWGLIAAVLGVVPFTGWFIPDYSTAAVPVYGAGYHAYTVALIGAYFALLRQTVLQLRVQTGVSRLELQLLLIGGCAVAGGILLLMGLRTLWGTFWLVRQRPQPLVVLFFYSATVVAITTSRIFDARQIFLVGVQKLSLLAGVTFAAYLINGLLTLIIPEWLAFVTTTTLVLSLASIWNGWLDRVFHFYPQAMKARQAAFLVAQKESRVEKLEVAFREVLTGWGQSDHALIISSVRKQPSGDSLETGDREGVADAIRQLRWVTPERLTRERPTSARRVLSEFLSKERLGVLVVAEGPSLTALVGVGVGASRRPYTYPQVTQLMELASIMEGALERAHFAAKVQHAEQLATVGLLGASLAHEIRNPLVSIKTFVQLLPTHHQDPAFREKFFRLIGHEVDRIDRLTVQLLDLASPRAYAAEMVELHPVLRASLDLVAAKATDKNIQFLTEFKAEPDKAYTDASAAKQVMLNLCFNAIQALDTREGERWIKVSTRSVSAGIEMAVADSGPGIAPEIRARLFQPFQSTKSSGFGLGLAICSDILANLNATITVDPHIPGSGATFRVIFPCQPSSS